MHISRLFDALLSMQESFESQKQLWKGIYLPRRHLPTTTAYPSQASSACDLVKEKKHHPLPCSVAFFVCGARFYTIIVSFINWPWQNELLGNKIKSFQLNHCKKLHSKCCYTTLPPACYRDTDYGSYYDQWKNAFLCQTLFPSCSISHE